MKLALIMVARDDAVDLLDAQLAFHLNAGVDVAIVSDQSTDGAVGEILEPHVRSGDAVRVARSSERGESTARTQMAQLAVDEHGADWVIDARTEEFWWPRGESLKDVLVAIPPRYTIVQGLVRLFVPRPDGSESFAMRLVARRSMPSGESREPLAWSLRSIYRAASPMTVDAARADESGRVPLRAWYPVEVLSFPLRSTEQVERRYRGDGPEPRSSLEQAVAAAHRRGRLLEAYEELVVDDAALAAGIDRGTLVLDERLRDASRGGTQTFPVPNVADDAAYAVDCAAVGEVDLAALDRHIRELEARIALLEQRFWPTVRRRAMGIVRRKPS